MSYLLNRAAKYMLSGAGADEIGDDFVSFGMVMIPLPSKVCKELNERAVDEGFEPPKDWKP